MGFPLLTSEMRGKSLLFSLSFLISSLILKRIKPSCQFGWLCKLMASHLNITLVLLRKHNLEFIAIPNSPTSWLREMIFTECHGSRVWVSVFKKTSNDFPHVGRVENHWPRSCNNSSELHEHDRGWCTWHPVQPQNFTFDLSFGRTPLEHTEEFSKKSTFKVYTEITKRPSLKCLFVKLYITFCEDIEGWGVGGTSIWSQYWEQGLPSSQW